MTKEQVKAVLDKYELRLAELRALDENTLSLAFIQKDQIEHAYEMIPKMRSFIEEDRTDKLFRWLGFLQGVFHCNGIYTLDELKDHNRTVIPA